MWVNKPCLINRFRRQRHEIWGLQLYTTTAETTLPRTSTGFRTWRSLLCTKLLLTHEGGGLVCSLWSMLPPPDAFLRCLILTPELDQSSGAPPRRKRKRNSHREIPIDLDTLKTLSARLALDSLEARSLLHSCEGGMKDRREGGGHAGRERSIVENCAPLG